MFEKFRLKNLSKVIQSAISNLSEQFTKRIILILFLK
ncbi:hypothetical protein JMUB5056_0332 [Leptotrichia hongkongensis]|uniref:Uncharacterized protein n=1 Tax=Leptotrichia hongkongensis TaxID=554406 RepID=A0A510L442_9FUSO|nr:hypothetical protein JMUB5056_0332 [Leptotrichia hongkongensis]